LARFDREADKAREEAEKMDLEKKFQKAGGKYWGEIEDREGIDYSRIPAIIAFKKPPT